MKKILLASGCSFTDIGWTSDFHNIGPNAWSMWPELLAKKLDMQCINVAYSGAGNEYIYSSLLDAIMSILPTSSIGLVIPGWSQVSRRDWKIKKKWKNNSEYAGDPSTFWNDMKADIDKSLRYFYSLQEICKSKKIHYKAVQMLHPFRGWSWSKEEQRHKENERFYNVDFLKRIHNSIYFDKIDDSFIGWPGSPELGGFSIKSDILKGYEKESLPWAVSERDNHPNAKGQEKIAEFLYDRLG